METKGMGATGRLVAWPARAVLLVMLVVPAVAGAVELKEPETGVSFDSTAKVGEQTYECLGTGVRKVLWFKAYAVAFCLDAKHARRLVDDWVKEKYPNERGPALAKALQSDAAFFARLAREPADRLVVMKMTRDVSRDKLASSFRDSLSDVLPKASIEKLVAAIPRDAKNGDVVRLAAVGPRLTIDIAGEENVIDDAKITERLWDVWLSTKSVAPGLRSSIAAHTAERLSK